MFVFNREKDEDEGIPSETEEDRKQQQNRTKEIRGEQPCLIADVSLWTDAFLLLRASPFLCL